MSCIVSFNTGLLSVNKLPVKSLGIDLPTYSCTKPSNTSNKHFNTTDSCLRLSKKKLLHRKFPVIRASMQLDESIKDENEKDIYTGNIPEFKYRKEFYRLRKNIIDGVDLQSAIVSYHKNLPGSILQPRLQVALVTACHIADKEYYADLQQELDTYDRVLYGLITKKDPIKESNRNPETRWKPQGEFHALSSLHRFMAPSFGLYAQIDSLDYRRDNWYNADIDEDTHDLMLLEAKKKRMDSILAKETDISSEAITVTPTYESLEMAGASSATLKKFFYARECTLEYMPQPFTSELIDGCDERNYSVIIEERNKVVMEELRAAMNGGCERIAILFGAGNMPDMDKRLRTEFDLVPTQISWKTAWVIRNQETSGQKQLPLLPPFSLILAVFVALGARLLFNKRQVR